MSVPGTDKPALLTKPILRWAGSKRKLVPTLLRLLPRDYDRYFEPFVGSACLFFALRPARAVLGDINAELMLTYETIRSHPIHVARGVLSLKNDASTYYRLRATPPDTLRAMDRAVRFVYLNRHCFNGVYRINRKGQFNVPRGSRTGHVPSYEAFHQCAKSLKSAELLAVDFEECLKHVRKRDFVYLDPPYGSTTRKTSGEYGYDCFGETDLPRLLRVLHHIDRVGARFLLSYRAVSVIPKLPNSWHRSFVRVRRHVAGFVKDRNTVSEMLLSNFRDEVSQ
jgi:DNA adenine methylase